MSSNIVRFDAIRSLNLSQLIAATAYTPLGVAFTHAMRVLHFINDSNGTFMISFDGFTDNIAILSAGFSLYDLTCDQDQNESFRYEIGTQLYIKNLVAPSSVATTTNSFYVTSVYGRGE